MISILGTSLGINNPSVLSLGGRRYWNRTKGWVESVHEATHYLPFSASAGPIFEDAQMLLRATFPVHGDINAVCVSMTGASSKEEYLADRDENPFLRPCRPGRSRPACALCAPETGNGATRVCAQSEDRGETVNWLLVCADCAYDWNVGGDWDAPVFHLTEVSPRALPLGNGKGYGS